MREVRAATPGSKENGIHNGVTRRMNPHGNTRGETAKSLLMCKAELHLMQSAARTGWQQPVQTDGCLNRIRLIDTQYEKRPAQRGVFLLYPLRVFKCFHRSTNQAIISGYGKQHKQFSR